MQHEPNERTNSERQLSLEPRNPNTISLTCYTHTHTLPTCRHAIPDFQILPGEITFFFAKVLLGRFDTRDRGEPYPNDMHVQTLQTPGESHASPAFILPRHSTAGHDMWRHHWLTFLDERLWQKGTLPYLVYLTTCQPCFCSTLTRECANLVNCSGGRKA